jgi:alpha-1,4-digalacturonate transport system permease protein
MFGQEYGLVNFIIKSMGGEPLKWSLNPTLATIVISIASSWSSAGFYMIIFIGGINNIPREINEASSIDGANGIQNLFRVTLPMLKPTTFLVLLLSTINLLKEYTVIQGISLGGPGMSTTYIIQYIYDKGFKEFEYGYASAVSMVALILFIVMAAFQFKVNRGGEID